MCSASVYYTRPAKVLLVTIRETGSFFFFFKWRVRERRTFCGSFPYLTPQLQMESISHRLPRRTFVHSRYEIIHLLIIDDHSPVFLALLFQCKDNDPVRIAHTAKKTSFNHWAYISNSTVLMLGLYNITAWVYSSLLYRSAAAAVGKYTRRKCKNERIDPLHWLSYTYPCFVSIYSECRVFYAVPHMIEHGIEFNIFFFVFFRFVRLFPLGGQKNSTNVPKSIDWSIV